MQHLGIHCFRSYAHNLLRKSDSTKQRNSCPHLVGFIEIFLMVWKKSKPEVDRFKTIVQGPFIIFCQQTVFTYSEHRTVKCWSCPHANSLVLFVFAYVSEFYSCYCVCSPWPTQPSHPSVGRHNEYWWWFRSLLGKTWWVLHTVCCCALLAHWRSCLKAKSHHFYRATLCVAQSWQTLSLLHTCGLTAE